MYLCDRVVTYIFIKIHWLIKQLQNSRLSMDNLVTQIIEQTHHFTLTFCPIAMGKCQEHVTNYDFACFLSLSKTFATLPPSCILSLMAIVHNNSGQFVRSLYFFFLFDLPGQLESKNFSTQNLSHILTRCKDYEVFSESTPYLHAL